jgi:ABC-type transport system involved in cytochrome c biogenesis ATPase subunit
MSVPSYSELSEIRVRKLVNLFDYRIPLSTDQHTTILIAPNGYGKTSILRLLDAFFNGRYAELGLVPFSYLSFAFRQGPEITVTIQLQKEEKFIRIARQGRQKEEFALPLPATDPRRSREGDQRLSEMARMQGFRRVGPGQWLNPQFDTESITTDDLWSLLAPDRRPTRQGLRPVDEPLWLQTIRTRTPVVLIGSERLRIRNREGQEGEELALGHYARVVAKKIQDASLRYTEESQNLDRTYPKRFFASMSSGRSTLTDSEGDQLVDRAKKLSARYTELAKAGLVDAKSGITDLAPHELAQVAGRAMELYIEDNEKKLAAFDDIFARIEALYSITGSRFINKSLKVDRVDGLVVQCGNAQIDLSKLSSGEQHQVRLWAQLLFDVPTGALVLIDEPELSLHVGWQREFLTDLDKVTQVAHVDFLISTHSAQIVANRPSLAIELDDLTGDAKWQKI